jgi:hypothetical protein
MDSSNKTKDFSVVGDNSSAERSFRNSQSEIRNAVKSSSAFFDYCGNRIVNVVPLPGALSTWMRPLWSSMTRLT